MAKFVKYSYSGNAWLTPTKDTIDGIEEAIRWAQVETPQKFRMQMARLVLHMAIYNQGVARKMSFGPFDPTQSNPSAAWQIPVRRISNAYYMGWKVKQYRSGDAILYNDSREAFFIEFGINPRGHGRRVRRPIRKMSLRKTMDFMRTTQAFHRVWVDIFSSPKHRHRGRGFYQIVQSPAGSYTRWENVSEHEARGVIRRVIRAGRQADYSKHVRLTPSGWQVARKAGLGNTRPRLGRRLP